MIWDFFTDFLTGDQREESKKIKEIKGKQFKCAKM